MNKRLLIITITAYLLLSGVHVLAFDLFDSNRGKLSPESSTPVKSTVFSKPFQAPTQSRLPEKKRHLQKDFVLLGTSRMGNKRTVILKGPDNKVFIQHFKNNTRTAITGYEGYYLLEVEPREIRIEYPVNTPCRNDKEELKCSADQKRALLTFKPRERVAPQRSSQSLWSKNTQKRKEIQKKRSRRIKKTKVKLNSGKRSEGLQVEQTFFGKPIK